MSRIAVIGAGLFGEICGVYHIINKTNGRTYIGSSKNVRKRLGEHRRLLRNGVHPLAVMQSDYVGGHSFSYELLQACLPTERLVLEQSFVSGFDGELYNIARRVSAGSCDEEVQRRISEGVRRQWATPDSNVRKAVAKKWRDLTYRSEMSQRARLYKPNEEIREKIRRSWTPERRELQAQLCRQMVKIRKPGKREYTQEQRDRAASLCKKLHIVGKLGMKIK